jgi:hypothetical protein
LTYDPSLFISDTLSSFAERHEREFFVSEDRLIRPKDGQLERRSWPPPRHRLGIFDPSQQASERFSWSEDGPGGYRLTAEAKGGPSLRLRHLNAVF